MTTPDTHTFDGFISYSHAADGLLAPRLQSALQRFAKPWWKRRAVRIFRDESSLSANPHLWSSITEALDTSGWFVLLLSPDAARSGWVNQEIAYWVEHRDPKKILPVVTGGEFDWENSDVTGDAVPDALRGVFTDEPRWVDVRWAKDEDQLDLQDPRFADAIADIASTIRGIPKDDLASEEVRQHRRTVRTAWAAGGLVTVLAIAAIGFGFQSANNADEAERQAEIAAANAAAEAVARKEADANAAAESAAREEADQNAQLAGARELAASAIAVVDADPRLATLLALESVDQTPAEFDQPVETINALWSALLTNSLVGTVDVEGEGNVFVNVAPDGASIAISDADSARLHLWDSENLEPIWEYSEETVDGFARPVFSPDSRWLALDIVDSEAVFRWSSADHTDDLPSRVVVLDTATGEVVETIDFPGCRSVGTSDWSWDGRLLAVGVGVDGCIRSDIESELWVEVFDTETWESIAVLEAPSSDAQAISPKFIGDDQLGLFPWTGIAPIYDTGSFQRIGELAAIDSAGVIAVSPDTATAAVWGGDALRTTINDLETGRPLDTLGQLEAWPTLPYGLEFSRDGRQLASATSGRVLVWDLTTGEQTHQLAGGAGATSAAFGSDGSTLYTGHENGAIRIWDLRPGGAAVAKAGSFPGGSFVNGNKFVIGETVGSLERFEGPNVFLEWFSTETGELLAEPQAISTEEPRTAIEGDRFLVFPKGASRWQILDPLTGSATEVGEDCADTAPQRQCVGLVSVDGTQLAIAYAGDDGSFSMSMFNSDGQPLESKTVDGLLVFPRAFTNEWIFSHDGASRIQFTSWTGEELISIDYGSSEVSPSGRRVAVVGGDGSITLVDTESWTTTESPPLGLGRTRGIQFDASETRLATADENEILILDLGLGEVVQEIPIPLVSDFHWIDESTLLIADRSGGIFGTVSLDVAELIRRAEDSVSDRPFSTQECLTYRIVPCLAEEG